MTKKKEDGKEIFAKKIKYNKEPWLEDVIYGYKGLKNHAHITTSGSAVVWYWRNQEGATIIKDGKEFSKNTL